MALHDRILLATDLSARSDRAFDRALMLAARSNAELVVLHVIEPVSGSRYYPRRQPLSELAALVREQLIQDLGDSASNAQIRIEEGDPAEVIEHVARELKSTLVVVGVARVERLGRFVLGHTVERLVGSAETPLLIVTDRPRGPYARIAVAVDFSSVSTQTLELVTSLYPRQQIAAVHAYQPVTYGASDVALAAEQWRRVAEKNYVQWLDTVKLPVGAHDRIVPRIEHGEPSRVIREAASHRDFDLVVIGTRRRGRIAEFFIGSVAKQILQELPCDALFICEAK